MTRLLTSITSSSQHYAFDDPLLHVAMYIGQSKRLCLTCLILIGYDEAHLPPIINDLVMA